MWSSSEIGVYRLVVCLDIFLKLVGRFEGDFATDGSYVSLIEEGVLLVNRNCHGQ